MHGGPLISGITLEAPAHPSLSSPILRRREANIRPVTLNGIRCRDYLQIIGRIKASSMQILQSCPNWISRKFPKAIFGPRYDFRGNAGCCESGDLSVL